MNTFTRRFVIGIVACYILGFIAHGLLLKSTVYGDGRYYYSWLHSIVIDHDVNFTNEYQHFFINSPQTPRGIPGNKYSIGPALLWMPSYIFTQSIVRGTGWSLPYQIAVGLTSLLAALFGLVLLLRIIKQPPGAAALTILLIAGATNLLFYGSLDTVNSHALSFFVATVYMALVMAPKKRWFAVGFALGILASIRLQDAVFVLLLLPYWKKIRLWPCVTGAVIGFLPQITAWYLLYGTLLNPYLSGGERFDFLHPHILSVLFSPNNGLILWTPVVGIGLIGLILKWRVYWSYLAVFVAELLIVSSWSTWWQGASVSGRMFVSSLPLIAVGLGSMVRIPYRNRLNRMTLPLLALSLCLLNAMIIVYYLVTH